MSIKNDEDTTDGGTFSSPPCFMHEIDPAYFGLVMDPGTWRDVQRWRKAQRERLIAARMALSVAERTEHAALIARDLASVIADRPNPIISFYWPFRGEPDLRAWAGSISKLGARVALPIVAAKAQPLIFREWRPETPLERGIWNIPQPAEGDYVHPNIVIAPLVGFDEAGYRLGYGGGYFDRTLASLPGNPLAIGVGHPVGALPTIYPQAHDIPMNWIVTGIAPPKQTNSKA